MEDTIRWFFGIAFLSGVVTGSTVTFWLLYLTNETIDVRK